MQWQLLQNYCKEVKYDRGRELSGFGGFNYLGAGVIVLSQRIFFIKLLSKLSSLVEDIVYLSCV